jgi:hypothetical protein
MRAPPVAVPVNRWAPGRAWPEARLIIGNSIRVILPTTSWAYASDQPNRLLDGHLVGSYRRELPRGADAVGPGNPDWSPARRTDGSGRRTAGRWVAPPAVAAVRFKRPSGRRTRLSRARLGKATGVPRGADDPQGPIGREQAGSPAGHPDGVLGGCPSQSSSHSHRAAAPGSAPTKAGPAQQHPPCRSPQATARPRPSRPTCPHSWPSTWRSVVARRTAGSGPVLAHHGSVAPVRRELTGSLARGGRRNGPKALTLL